MEKFELIGVAVLQIVNIIISVLKRSKHRIGD